MYLGGQAPRDAAPASFPPRGLGEAAQKPILPAPLPDVVGTIDAEGRKRLDPLEDLGVWGVAGGFSLIESRSIPNTANDASSEVNHIYAPTAIVGSTEDDNEGVGCLEITLVTADDDLGTGLVKDAEYLGVWDFCEETTFAYWLRVNQGTSSGNMFWSNYVRTSSVSGHPTFWFEISIDDHDGDSDLDTRAYIYNWTWGQWDTLESSDPYQHPTLTTNLPWVMSEMIDWQNSSGHCGDVDRTDVVDYSYWEEQDDWVHPRRSSDWITEETGPCWSTGDYDVITMSASYLQAWAKFDSDN